MWGLGRCSEFLQRAFVNGRALVLRPPRRHRHVREDAADATCQAPAARCRSDAARGAAATQDAFWHAAYSLTGALGPAEARRRNHLSDLEGRRATSATVVLGPREDKQAKEVRRENPKAG